MIILSSGRELFLLKMKRIYNRKQNRIYPTGSSHHNFGIKKSKETIEKLKKAYAIRKSKGEKIGYQKGHKLSPESIEKMKKSKTGVKNPLVAGEKSNLWKGGITPIMKMIRMSINYRQWRCDIFERDNYTCVWCGIRSGNGKAVELQADHIKPFYLILKENNIKNIEDSILCEELWNINNGRTLCRDCHIKTKTWGRPKK